MSFEYFSITPNPPPGFKQITIDQADLLSSPVAIYASRLDEAMSLISDYRQQIVGVIVTPGEIFSNRLGARLWHVQVPRDFQGDLIKYLQLPLLMAQSAEPPVGSEESYRTLYENLLDGVAAVNVSGHFIRSNAQFLKMLGFNSIEELSAKTVNELRPAKWAEHEDRIVREQVLVRGYSDLYEKEYIRKDGSVLPVEMRIYAIKDATGTITGFWGFIRDITDRKRAEKELAFQNLILKTQQDTSLDGILVVSPKGDILSYNQRFAVMWGIPSEILATKSDELALNSVTSKLVDPKQFTEKVDYLYHHPSETSFDKIALADGRLFERYSSPMTSYDGQNYGRVWYFRDITEHQRAEEELRASEKRFSLFVQFSPIPLYIKDADTRAIVLSQHFAETFGKPLPELLGKTNDELWPAELAKAMTIDDKKVINEACVIEREELLQGRIYWSIKFPIFLENRPAMLGGFSIDITEQRKAQAALKESEESLQATLNSIGDAVIATDVKGKVLRMNPVAEKLTGWPLAEAYNKPLEEIFQIVSALTEEPVNNPVERVLESGSIVGLANHTMLISRNGEKIQISDSAAPIHDKDGKITGVVLVFRDVTEDYRIRCEIDEANKLLNAVIEHNPMSIEIVDEKGFVLKTNPAHTRLFGGMPQATYSVFQDPQIKAQKEIWSIFEEGMKGKIVEFPDSSYNAHHANPACPDRTVWIHAIMFPLFDKNQRPGKYVLIHQDITDRKLAEEEKDKLQDQLAQAQKMETIGRLAGGVAHDFNNMLGVIIGHADIAMEQTNESSPLHADIKQIRIAAQRSADLTRQLLAFARKETINPAVLDVNSTISNMIKMLQRLIGEDIKLNWNPGVDIWPVLIDPSQIDQILANLSVNARDAIDAGNGEGTLTIETQNIFIDKTYYDSGVEFTPGQYVMLAVTDNGIGMDGITLSQIFEPFFTTKEPGKGTGLGLAMVYGVVKQNGGFIGVDSEPGKGTTFRIYLPRTITTQATATTCETEKASTTGKETILLTEDEDMLRNIYKSALEKLGYKILTAATPLDAMEISGQYADQIHLLITDIVMPGINGKELSNKIAAGRAGIKTLFMSGYAANVIDKGTLIGGKAEFLQKPFSIKTLAKKVREILDL